MRMGTRFPGEGDIVAELKNRVKPTYSTEGKLLNKDAIIKREKERMIRLFGDFEPIQMVSINPMIDTIAFQTAAIMELEMILKIKGFTEEYYNGREQFGIKESSESKAYAALAKLRLSYLKQLNDILIKNSAKVDQDELMAFLDNK